MAFDYARRDLPGGDVAQALRELVALQPGEYLLRVEAALDRLEMVHPVTFRAEMIGYFAPWHRLLRAYFRRPSDITGIDVPPAFRLESAEELLPLLPPRRSLLGPGREPRGLDNWKLVELLGFGELTETWHVADAEHSEREAVLKFVTDHDAADDLRSHQAGFLEAFRLVHDAGILPLRSVYTETDPPAVETPYLDSYTLAGLMRDWRWQHRAPKASSSLKLMRRIAEIVAKAHRKGIVHRDLKPTNVLLHPTEGGKFTVWVSEFGWSQTAAARSLALARGGTPAAERARLLSLGAHSAVTASPQCARREPPDPRDDVYSLGVLWLQLLLHDPEQSPAELPAALKRLRNAGVPPVQLDLLEACLSERPDHRPADAGDLSDRMTIADKAAPDTATLPLKPGSTEYIALPLTAESKSATDLPTVTPGPGYGGRPRYLTNSLGMTFVLLPPGEFDMGSPPSEAGRHAHESPVHTVRITRPLYVAAFLVTQSQFTKAMGKNPSLFTKANGGGPDHPVDSVSWNAAAKFCEKLSEVAEEEERGRSYRLPTEAEWEYACRAGTVTPFAFGERITTKTAHFATGQAFDKSGGVARTAAVGSMPPNPFGLYDLHGNLQEWCSDWYGAYYYADSPRDDPPGPATGTDKILRGGCYTMFGSELRSAARKCAKPNIQNATIGFRVVMSVPARM